MSIMIVLAIISIDIVGALILLSIDIWEQKRREKEIAEFEAELLMKEKEKIMQDIEKVINLDEYRKTK